MQLLAYHDTFCFYFFDVSLLFLSSLFRPDLKSTSLFIVLLCNPTPTRIYLILVIRVIVYYNQYWGDLYYIYIYRSKY